MGRGQVRSRRPRGLALSPPLARQRASFPESPCFPSQWSDPVGSAPSPGHDSAGRALLSHGHEVCHSGQGSGRSCFGGLLLGPCPVSACSLAHFCRRLGARGAGGAGRAENARSARQALGPASATRGHSGAGQMITDTVFFCLLFQCDFRRKKKYRNPRGRTRKSRPVPRRL